MKIAAKVYAGGLKIETYSEIIYETDCVMLAEQKQIWYEQ